MKGRAWPSHYRSSAAGAEETAARVRELGGDAMTVQGDVAVWDDVVRIAEEAFAHFGRLDVLVNNVGDMAASQMSWRELSAESVDHTIALDIKGTLLMTHEVGRRMLDDQRSGDRQHRVPGRGRGKPTRPAVRVPVALLLQPRRTLALR